MSAISIRLLICIMAVAFTLSMIIDRQNELTELRLKIPVLVKEVRAIEARNTAYQYEIERFESPIHLIELLRKPEFGHLKHPYESDILILQ